MRTAVREPKIELIPVTPVESGSGFYDYLTDIKNRTEKRAYELFERRGKTHGHDIDDGLKAERQILNSVPLTLNEAEHLYVVTADVSGFAADELDVRVEPFRIFITGTKRSLSVGTSAQPEQMLQPIDLGHEIETNTVIAELSNGVLTISMRKVCVPAVAKRGKSDSSKRRKRSAELHKRVDIAKRYTAAADDQLQRATANGRQARAHATQRAAKARSKQVASETQPSALWTEEVPHSLFG